MLWSWYFATVTETLRCHLREKKVRAAVQATERSKLHYTVTSRKLENPEDPSAVGNSCNICFLQQPQLPLLLSNSILYKQVRGSAVNSEHWLQMGEPCIIQDPHVSNVLNCNCLVCLTARYSEILPVKRAMSETSPPSSGNKVRHFIVKNFK